MDTRWRSAELLRAHDGELECVRPFRLEQGQRLGGTTDCALLERSGTLLQTSAVAGRGSVQVVSGASAGARLQAVTRHAFDRPIFSVHAFADDGPAVLGCSDAVVSFVPLGQLLGERVAPTEVSLPSWSASESATAVPGRRMPSSRVCCVRAQSLNSSSTVVALRNNTVSFIDVAAPSTNNVRSEVLGSSANLCADWSPFYETVLAIGGCSSALRVADMRTANVVQRKFDHHHEADVTCLAWHPSMSSWVASGSADGTISMWDLRYASVPRMTFRHCEASVQSIAWLPSHPGLLVSGAGDGYVRFWGLAQEPHYFLGRVSPSVSNVVAVLSGGVPRSSVYAASMNGETVRLEPDPSFLAPLAPAPPVQTSGRTAQVAVSMLFVRDLVQGCEMMSSAVEALQRDDRAADSLLLLDVAMPPAVPLPTKESLLAVVDASVWTSAPVADGGASGAGLGASRSPAFTRAGGNDLPASSSLSLSGGGSSALQPTPSFGAVLDQVVLHVPRAAFDLIPSSMRKRMESTRVRLSVANAVRLGDGRELIKLRDRLLGVMREDPGGLSDALLRSVTVTMMRANYLLAIEFAFSSVQLYAANAEHLVTLRPMLEVLLLPSIYEPTDDAPESARERARTTEAALMAHPTELCQQLAIMQESYRALWSSPQGDQRLLEVLSRVRAIHVAAVYRLYLNTLIHLRRFDRFYVTATAVVSELEHSRFGLVVEDLMQNVALPRMKTFLEDCMLSPDELGRQSSAGADEQLLSKPRVGVLLLVNIMQNAAFLPAYLLSFIPRMLNRLCSVLDVGLREMLARPNTGSSEAALRVAQGMLEQLRAIRKDKPSRTGLDRDIDSVVRVVENARGSAR